VTPKDILDMLEHWSEVVNQPVYDFSDDFLRGVEETVKLVRQRVLSGNT
jgi:hypothetical protein